MPGDRSIRVLLEGCDSWPSQHFVGFELKIRRPGRAIDAHTREWPSSARRKLRHLGSRIGRRQNKGRLRLKVRPKSLEPIRPQRAIRASRTHVVNQEHIVKLAEKLRQFDLAAVSIRQFVICNRHAGYLLAKGKEPRQIPPKNCATLYKSCQTRY